MLVRTRFAPSPTGYVHIGSVWTALFAWMYARKYGGQFILRIEDTDTKRTVPGAVQNLIDSLHWFGIEWEEGPDIGGPHAPYTQTKRLTHYQEWAHWLVDHGYAYKCFATPQELEEMRKVLRAKGDYSGYDRRYRDLPAGQVAALEAEGRPYAIRFKMPLTGTTIIPDLLRGNVVFDNSYQTDYVLLKSNGLPTYHLAVVVDDHLMQITHVTRGVEWLGTAPVHIQLYQAFGWQMPVWVHFPVILNPNGRGKLSKRKQAFLDNGQPVLVRASEFMAAGYLHQAVVNFLTNIGWSYGENREIYSLQEAIARFELADLSSTPTKLPYSKLDWLNGQYIQQVEPLPLAEAMQPFLKAAGIVVSLEMLLPLMPAMRVRMKRLTDSIDFLKFLAADAPSPHFSSADLSDKKLPPAGALAAFQQARDFIQNAQPFDLPTLEQGFVNIGEQFSSNGKAGPFLGRMRLAVTGQQVSPPLYESMLALGRERTIARLELAIKVLAQDG